MTDIAVIQTAFPGDLILTTPVFQSLKEAGHRVTAVIRAGSESILENNPYLCSIITFDKKGGVGGFLRCVNELNKRRCDVAIIAQKHLRSVLLAIYAGIERRIGFDSAPGGFAYTDIVPFDRSAHAVVRYLSLCAGFSATGGLSPRIFVSENHVRTVNRLLSEKGISADRLIALAPGSIWNTKRWPFFKELAELIIEESEFDLAVIGGKDDIWIGEQIASAFPNRAITFAGRLTLIESAAAIGMAELAVTNDSAPAHMAAAVGTPLIAIFGPTVPAFGFTPFSDKAIVIENKGLYCRPCSSHGPQRCPEKHFYCMRGIKPSVVWQAARKLLGIA